MAAAPRTGPCHDRVGEPTMRCPPTPRPAATRLHGCAFSFIKSINPSRSNPQKATKIQSFFANCAPPVLRSQWGIPTPSQLGPSRFARRCTTCAVPPSRRALQTTSGRPQPAHTGFRRVLAKSVQSFLCETISAILICCSVCASGLHFCAAKFAPCIRSVRVASRQRLDARACPAHQRFIEGKVPFSLSTLCQTSVLEPLPIDLRRTV